MKNVERITLPGKVTIAGLGVSFDVTFEAEIEMPQGLKVLRQADVVDQRMDLLTPRERQVLELAREELSNKEVASKLNLTERTAKFHRSTIFRKFQVGTVAQLLNVVGRKT
jgi:DNA-binding CsgD family transcriptional regulator